MIRILPKSQSNSYSSFIRRLSSDSSKSTRRFMQTAPLASNDVSYIPYKFHQQQQSSNASSQANSESNTSSKSIPSGWERHSISRSFKDLGKKSSPQQQQTQPSQQQTQQASTTPTPTPTKEASTTPKPARKVRRTLKPRKALITLSQTAVQHLRGLLDQPEPKLIKIGVKNRGCSGLTYHLEYISEPNKFDEVIEQDGVKVIIDSKALFSIVGSEMDWLDDKISSRFIFKNPNSKGTCGCGESFMV
ncbi:putative iron-sulfur cluster insertion protein [Wickerhamomyces ciferrii]|uniref:Iron-sulfur assembly protein 1 n=1 Tax=Wickerhamomyces ciferrii (strain ATCC 14091 / BCRC 22168 / CBS 111 / JCM 3599 / NBRC 0793 / NRRL Y-1031 F-60-10) TaxID=1206466 RepID=K0KWU6_WICCF|nr:putative iron-sulfur cluster insertion protein [Wickerhamomyces ciferrii]CCH45578.1 putative iron-sulfur cluster insertion protein [Wickerhamomyces ciferrii]